MNRDRGDERGPAAADDGTCFIDMAAAAPSFNSRILVERSSSRTASGEANGRFCTFALVALIKLRWLNGNFGMSNLYYIH